MMVYKQSAPEKNTSDISQLIKRDPTLLETSTSGGSRYITVTQKVVMKEMCGTFVSVFTQAVRQVEIVRQEHMARTYS